MDQDKTRKKERPIRQHQATTDTGGYRTDLAVALAFGARLTYTPVSTTFRRPSRLPVLLPSRGAAESCGSYLSRRLRCGSNSSSSSIPEQADWHTPAAAAAAADSGKKARILGCPARPPVQARALAQDRARLLLRGPSQRHCPIASLALVRVYSFLLAISFA